RRRSPRAGTRAEDHRLQEAPPEEFARETRPPAGIHARARDRNPHRRGEADQDRKTQARAEAGRRRACRGRGSRTRRDRGAQAQGTGQDASQGREEAAQNPGEEDRQAEIGRQRQEEVMISSQSWITNGRLKDLKPWPTRKQADHPATAATRTVS